MSFTPRNGRPSGTTPPRVPWPLLGMLLPWAIASCDESGARLPGQAGDGPRDVAADPGQPSLTISQGLSLPLGSEPALPLTNATLGLSPDGATAVASDPEGARLFVVSLNDEPEVRSVSLAGDVPGRLAVGDTTAYVLLRDAGFVVAVDTAAAVEQGRAGVCPSPQGVTVDGDRVHVACRDGQLVTLDAVTLEELRRVQLDDDLRDLVVRGDGLVVSRFRSAELLFVDSDGVLERRIRPALSTFDMAARPTLAWRLLALDDGRLLLAHQLSRTTDVIVGQSGYSGSCGSIAAPAVSLIDPDYEPANDDEPPRFDFPANRPQVDDPYAHLTRARFVAHNTAGVLDVAASAHGFYLVAPGNALTTFPTIPPGGILLRSDAPPAPTAGLEAVFTASFAEGDFSPCSLGTGRTEPAVPVSVAYDPEGARVVLQTRSPAMLKIVDGPEILLHDEDRTNTGFHMFHMNTGGGIACASCHPEGREDGHTWLLGSRPRRTQSLEGGIGHLAPFHWDGEFDDFRQLVDDVLVTRMGLGHQVSDEQVDLLTGFLDTLPPAPIPVLDDAAVERGKSLFASARTECWNCHAGAAFTDNELHDVGTGGTFVTPPLTGLASRAPYLHDGCAATLEDRFGLCGGGDAHGKTSDLSEDEIQDLIAFLKSL